MLKEINFYLEINKSDPAAAAEFRKYMEALNSGKPFIHDGIPFIIYSVVLENDKIIVKGALTGVVKE